MTPTPPQDREALVRLSDVREARDERLRQKMLALGPVLAEVLSDYRRALAAHRQLREGGEHG